MKPKNRSNTTKTRRASTSTQAEWKKILPVLGVVLVLLAGAAGLRAVLVSQHHAPIGRDYTLIDGYGKTRTQADFYGHFTLLYFGYTHCVDVCPLTLATVSAALDELGAQGGRVTPVFISVDPERDTPEVIQNYVQRFSPRIVGLTGSEAQLQPVMKAFHVSARHRSGDGAGYLVDHSSLLYLMDGQNHLAGMIPVDSSAHQIAADLKRLLPPS